MWNHYGRRQPQYGRGEHEIVDAPDAPPEPAQLRAELVRVFGDRKFKPPVLPAAAHELLEMSRRVDVSFREVQSVVEKDSSLAGRVLQVAQSPLFATRVKAKTLRDAVQRLGVNHVRDIVWQVSLDMRVFRAPGYDPAMNAVQRHSVATAYAARVVCDYTSVAADYAFLCGLLHDIGVSGLLIALSERRTERRIEIDSIWPAIEQVHENASAYMVRFWKLDSDLERVVGQHHRFDAKSPPHPLVAVVTVAEYLVCQQGFGVLAGPVEESLFDRLSERQYLNALACLNISDAMVRRLTAELGPILEKL